jgi:hypothetical protein
MNRKKQKKIKTHAELEAERELIRRALRVLFIYIGLPLATLFLWAIWMGSAYRGLATQESMEIAQLAEHISAGDGFVTSVLRPLGLGIVPVVQDHPDLMHPPLYPLLEGAMFLLFDTVDRLAAVTSGLGWMLCAWMTYLLGRQVLGTRRVAALGCVLLFLNVPLLNASVSGTGYTWAALWVTMILLLTAQAVRREEAEGASLPWLQCGAAGICMGLLALTEYSLVLPVLIPQVAFWARWARRAGVRELGRKRSIKTGMPRVFGPGVRMAGLLLLTCLAVCLPWLIRNVRVAGGPFVSLAWFTIMQDTASFPGTTIFRSQEAAAAPLFYLLLRFPAVVNASLRALPPLPMALARLCNPVALVLFVVGLFMARDTTTRRIRSQVVQMLAWAVVFFSLFSKQLAGLAALVPVISVLAAGTLVEVCRKRRPDMRYREYWAQGKNKWRVWVRYLFAAHWHLVLVSLILLVAAAPFFSSRMNTRPRQRLVKPPGLEQLEAATTADDLIMTDSPWAVAWWGKRMAVWLPQQQEVMDAWLEDEALAPDWIYLRGFPGMRRLDYAAWWVEMLREPDIPWMGYSGNLSENEQAMLRRQ